MSERNYQQLVDYLMAGNWPICEATVQLVAIKPNGIKLTLVIEGDQSGLHDLADLGETGGGVLLVLDSYSTTPAADQAQDDLFRAMKAGEESSPDEPPADPADPPAVFNPNLDMPPDDDLSSYENPIAEEDEEGFFNEKLDKPPLG